MQRYKKLGVFLHDSPADDTALEYTGVFAKLAESESVYCIHVREPELEEEDPDVAALEAEVRRKLPADVAKITKVEVHKGTGVPEILRSARDDELDMIIVGRRLPSEQLGIGDAFSRLARKAPCNVLVVPTHAQPHLERIFVPVDLSEHSKLALEQAIAIVKAGGAAKPQLVVHSNFTIGYGYSKLGMSLPEAIAEREKVGQTQMQEFIADMDAGGLDVEVVCTCSENTVAAIQEVAVAHKMNLIVVGSRGLGADFMLGSTAERILLHSMLPVLIVKKKGETRHILDALFGSG
ncbi:MAG: universal stress protein [Phycisphaerae bacterium]|nr:universal stress protein [Phycisphaerae bacterium]